jgi:alkylhydroperoxidase family enzyme
MRLGSPRIAPLDMERLEPDQQAVLAPFTDPANRVGGGKVLNIFRTLAHAPKALTAFLGWGNYVLSRRSDLPAREREIAILRTGFLCGAGYEFAQHERIGLASGMTAEEVAGCKEGPGAACWNDLDRAIVTACDELVGDHFVSDATWAALEPLGDKGRMDLVFTVGQYTQVSMILNSFGVQLEDPSQLDRDLDRR